MPTFHTLEEAIEEFRRKHTDLVGKLYTGEKSASHIEDFLSLVWQSAQEARNRELVEKLKTLPMGYFIPEEAEKLNVKMIVPERLGAMSYNAAIKDVLSLINK